jgi:D-aspartate ligase
MHVRSRRRAHTSRTLRPLSRRRRAPILEPFDADDPVMNGIEQWLASLPPSPPIAVVLGGQANGLSFVRSLGRHGVPTLMLAGHDPRSRYARTLELRNAVQHPEDWLATLERVGRHLKVRGVLLPTSDPLVLLAARNEARLTPSFRSLVPPVHVVEAIVNKRAQYEHAREAGVPIPETHFPESSAEVEKLSREVEYPCLLKPYLSHISKSALGAKALVVHRPEQLVSQYECHSRGDHRFMMQELIPGADDALFGYVALWDGDGNEHSWIVRRKLRQYPPAIGNGSLQVSVYDPEVAELGRRLIASFDYRGPVAVEFKRDPRDGVLRLIEINARTGASNQLTIDAGVDVPWMIYHMLTGCGVGERPQRGTYRRGVKWVYEELDFRAFLQLRAEGKLSTGEWLTSLKGTRAWAYWSRSDPVPLIVRAPAFLRFMARRATRRIRPSAIRPTSRAPLRDDPDDFGELGG